MVSLNQQLKKYAELVIRIGVNLQPGENLVIGFASRQVYPEHVEFARCLTEAAYDAGAKFVHVDYGDEWWMRETVKRGSLETLAERAKWQAQWVQKLADEGAAFIAIPASNPYLFDGIERSRVDTASKSIANAFRSFNDRRTNDEYTWCLASAPIQPWADVVFADLPAEERTEALWKAILKAARADGENPIEEWKQHIVNLQKRSQWLNQLNIVELHYRAPGTDLTIGMPDGHYWTAAGKPSQGGVHFVANIPTEEVFSAPHRDRVNGTVTSTMPLVHNGSLIEGIRIRFEAGRIVEYSAEKGEDALRHIIEADEGSHYLGEVALVPVDSPIYQMGRLFYNTLFDENASCHLAIGKAYPLIEGGYQLRRADWNEHGLNDSLMHVDFMIGSPEMNIDVKTKTGQMMPIMVNGKFVSME
ncbi:MULTISPECIES: aminopeptidase [Alicyclobacillus]|uniref:Aminopeptidase n=2 Tax=Alicyclobacillus tolerans TaxID=90970 RepID=A0A1M6U544_9BACL|nr:MULTISPECIES: aminopeptidase [Alicyclobacillus]MDP9727974.1 aminopeptidase [Alicyclobacillus tengchongensis]SHK64218.1 aminopeptidase [Alicyclobacillus montanus]